MNISWIVFVGGGLGSVVRFGLTNYFSAINTKFPIATFLSNLVSCFLLGYFLGLSEADKLSVQRMALLMVGFCGGFSTFSTFSMENIKLVQEGNLFLALAYTLLSVLLGCLLVYLGWKIVK